MSSSQFRYRPKIEKIGPSECRWTTSFGVRPDKELCGLKPLYSSLNNLIFSFASSSERNQLTFKHRSEEHTSELQSRLHLVCRLLLEKKKKIKAIITSAAV